MSVDDLMVEYFTEVGLSGRRQLSPEEEAFMRVLISKMGTLSEEQKLSLLEMVQADEREQSKEN